MKKVLVCLAAISSLTFGATTLQFGAESNIHENEYGERTSQSSVTVKTSNLQIERFWHKFKKGATNDALDVSMNTTIDFDLTTRASFLCKKYSLDAKGCSGQKPLFINKGTLANTELQVDAMGNALPSDEYRIPFDEASHYASDLNDAFYAMDIYRDMQYYKPQPDTPKESPKNFFARIIAFFKDYFSQDTTVYTSGNDNPDERQRYMTNLLFGAQQKYRLKKGDSVDTSSMNAATANGKKSLLDYNSQTIDTVSGCKGLLLNYDPDSLSCKTLRFFGVSQWMPFYKDNRNAIVNVNTTSVLEDTETTLLTLAGNLNNKNYVQEMRDKIDGIDNTSDSTFLQQLFKPMINMMSGMYRFFFGSRSQVTTQKVYLDFKFDKPLPISFAVVDNDIISGFEHFLLKGIESVYGTEVEECKVYQSASGPIGTAFNMMTGVPQYTIRPDIPLDSALSEFYLGKTHKVLPDDPGVRRHNLLNQRRKERKVCFPFIGCKGTGEYKVWAELTNQDWLNWCQRHKNDGGKKGLFGSFIDAIKGFFSRPSTYEAQIDDLFHSKGFYVGEYKEKVHKEMILHLKHIPVTDIGIGTAGTHTEYTIRDIRRDGEAKSKPDKNNKGNGGMHK